MSESRRVTYQRMGATAGIAAPILGFTCILIAIASYPAFNWTNNALSDLGIKLGITGPLFNFGLYASGLLAFNFAVFGLLTYLGNHWVGRIGAAVFTAATVALIAIGVFNESFSPTHYIVSVAFFVLTPVSLLILTSAFWLNHQHGMVAFTVAVAVATALPWILEFAINYAPNVAIPETASGLAVSAWAIVLSAKMFKAAH